VTGLRALPIYTTEMTQVPIPRNNFPLSSPQSSNPSRLQSARVLWSVRVMALFGKDAPPALSAVVRKYGDVFSGRSESRLPFETARKHRASSRANGTCVSRRQISFETALRASRQGERIPERIYEMLHF